jgi:hypothetical protein
LLERLDKFGRQDPFAAVPKGQVFKQPMDLPTQWLAKLQWVPALPVELTLLGICCVILLVLLTQLAITAIKADLLFEPAGLSATIPGFAAMVQVRKTP